MKIILFDKKSRKKKGDPVKKTLFPSARRERLFFRGP
jgi:hypothetical protein